MSVGKRVTSRSRAELGGERNPTRARRSGVRSVLVPAFTALLGCLLTGCGMLGIGGGKPAPVGGIEKVENAAALTMKAGEEETKIVLKAADRLNTCGGEQSNILVVRLYQLKSDGALIGVSLSQLWDHEADELKGDLLEQAEFVMEPGQEQEITISSKSGASYLAVVADFCRADGECWRWIRPWKKVGSDKVLTFGENCIVEAKK